jgi:hypothetical protein
MAKDIRDDSENSMTVSLGNAVSSPGLSFTMLKNSFWSTGAAGTSTTENVSHALDITALAILSESINIGKQCVSCTILQCKASSKRAKQENYDVRFWTSLPVLLILIDICLAITLQMAWVLYGTLVVVLAQIMWIVLKWVLFVADDAELWKGVGMIKVCIRTILQEGENIAKGNASRNLMAGVCLRTAPSGFEYFKYIVRYRTQSMNIGALREMAEERRFAYHPRSIRKTVVESAKLKAEKMRKNLKRE